MIYVNTGSTDVFYNFAAGIILRVSISWTTMFL